MLEAKTHDGSTITIEVHGTGPTLLLPVNPEPAQGEQAEAMRAWGADPALGRSLMEGLGDLVRVAAFDYEGHVLAHPKPATLTPDNISADLLAVADAVGADRFFYYGYSWLALSGLQLALRTDRLAGLAMGGYPPVAGPYKEMLVVTNGTLRQVGTATGKEPTPGDWSTVEVDMSEAQARQFVTLYEALQDFDDSAAQARITCPRLCFAGSADVIEYDERFGGVRVDLAGPIARNRAELESLGWTVALLDGLDHAQAMQAPNALPVLRPWLAAHV